jgi:7-carboxy-7-deazaguanine synthase
VADTLVVNEIYLSLQGESTFAGLPCVFVRLTACNLRCSYCDTAYAFTEGKKWSFLEIAARVRDLATPYQRSSPPAATSADPLNKRPAIDRLPLIEFTGGEPLLQPGAAKMMALLCDEGFTVLVETSGALDISVIDARVRRIMDLKCPSSGEVQRNRWENLAHLRSTDEVKFVIGTREDYDWAREQLSAHQLAGRCPILFSWVAPLAAEQQHPALRPVPAGQTPLTRLELVERIIADALPVRFQLQMHKVIWAPEQRGV